MKDETCQNYTRTILRNKSSTIVCKSGIEIMSTLLLIVKGLDILFSPPYLTTGKRFGFANYGSREAAEEAFQTLNGAILAGNQLKVRQ